MQHKLVFKIRRAMIKLELNRYYDKKRNSEYTRSFIAIIKKLDQLRTNKKRTEIKKNCESKVIYLYRKLQRSKTAFSGTTRREPRTDSNRRERMEPFSICHDSPEKKRNITANAVQG